MRSHLFAVLVAICSVLSIPTAALPWEQNLDSNTIALPRATAIAMSPDGEVFVNGWRWNGSVDPGFRVHRLGASTGLLAWIGKAGDLIGSRGMPAGALTLASDGDVIAAGVHLSGTEQRFTVVCFSPAGVQRWRYELPFTGVEGFDNRIGPEAITVDGAGDVIVAGDTWSSTGLKWQFAVIKIRGSDGAQVWAYTADGDDGGADVAYGVAVDGANDVYATGKVMRYRGWAGLHDGMLVTKLAGGTGAPLWATEVWASPNASSGRAITVDASGNALVAGVIGNYPALLKFTTSGTGLWQYNPTTPGLGVALGLAVASDGNPVIAGYRSNEFLVAKISSATGSPMWTQLLGDGTSGPNIDQAKAIRVDGAGNILAAGRLNGSLAVVKFSAIGGELWRYLDGGGTAQGLTLDAAGNFAVAGDNPSLDNSGNSYRVIKRRGTDGGDYKCGDGVVDAGEQCDDGNTRAGDCCSGACQFEAAGGSCATDNNVCTTDQCNGSGSCQHAPNAAPCDDGVFCNGTDSCDAGSCSVHTGDPCAAGAECANVCSESLDDCNALLGTPCTDDGNVCTSDACDGSGACVHPPGYAGTTCRSVAGPCDVAELCTGTSSICPADLFSPGGIECRPPLGVCDLAETCTGTGPSCPADAKSTATCRASVDVCDVAESCDGSSNDCPTDVFEPAGTVCRTAAGVCDAAETCTGTGPSCPADAKSTATCRASVGACDVAESCDGSSNDCPTDAFEPAGTVCRTAAGACDLAETCSGTGAACPADGYRAAGTVCRASAGTCDPSELCSGLSAACPSDTKSTSVCRPAVGACDSPESCDGIAGACPADAPAPNGTPCDDGDACTGPDSCTAGVCSGSPNPTLCAGDTDADGVLDDADACPSTPGLTDRQGCPIGDANLVELHLVDQQKSGACAASAGSCKLPVQGAAVRVFDRNDLGFQAAYGTKNPSGTIYDQVFDNDIGRVGACTTDGTGRCTAGEEVVGDHLVIVRWNDASANRLVYTGKAKAPTDFVDTDGDHVRDLASTDFQIVKLIRRDGTVQISGGSKIVVTGSFLEIVHPDFAVWEDAANGYVYPFVFTSDSAWTVDVCASVPTGYDVVGVYDNDGNFHSSIECMQTFVADETRAVAFEVIETGSPEPTLFTRLRVKGGHLGRQTQLRIDVPGARRYPGERLLDSSAPACWERVNYSG